MSGPGAADPAAEHLTLPDGRRLAFRRFGDPGGAPTLYFHGLPGSHVEAAFASAQARSAGVALIAVDRPGYGGSSFQVGRTLLDWPDDVRALAAHLGLGRFSLLGLSGGGPYALACGLRAPELLHRIALAGPLGPLDAPRATQGMSAVNRLGLAFAAAAPSPALQLARAFAPLVRRHPELLLARLAAGSGPADRAALQDPKLRAALEASWREALRPGGRGFGHDLALLARPWGFDVSAVRVPVAVWHGEQDRVVPVRHARALVARLPRAEPRLLAGEGHFSLPLHHARAMLDGLARGGP